MLVSMSAISVRQSSRAIRREIADAASNIVQLIS